MTFEEIVAGQLDDIVVTYAPLGEPEDFVRCEDCGRLVRARPTAWKLHQSVTCELYRSASEGVGDRVNDYLNGIREAGL